MNDQELRDKLAIEHWQDIMGSISHGESFKAGWDAARANQEMKWADTIIKIGNERDLFHSQLVQQVEYNHHISTTIDVLRADSEREQARLKEELSKIVTERDQLRAEVDQFKALAERATIAGEKWKAEAERQFIETTKAQVNLATKTMTGMLNDIAIERNQLRAEVEHFHRCWVDAQTVANQFEAKLAKAKAALTTVLHQPFQGSWDAQAAFIQNTLAELERGENEP